MLRFVVERPRKLARGRTRHGGQDPEYPSARPEAGFFIVKKRLKRGSRIVLPRDCCGQSPDLRPVEGEETEGEVAALAKALAHPARVRIIRLLSSRTSCICGEIVDEVRLAQSTVSQHLKILKEAGLIQGTISGPAVCYCLEPRALRRLKALVAAL